MKLYIGMCAFNSGPIIEAAIRSTYAYAEQIIVVDGSAFGPSTDETAKIAQNIGPKVRLVQGTFKITSSSEDAHRMPLGAWAESDSRKAYKELLPFGCDNWVLIQDSDEVWDDENMERLLKYIEVADSMTWAFTTSMFHFWIDAKHIRTGGIFNAHRPLGVNRIIPEQSDFKRIPLDDVKFYHYGHALSTERKRFKVRQYLERGDYIPMGYGIDEWDRFYREYWTPWETDFNIPGVVPFTGEHPSEVCKIMDKIWTT